MKRTNGRHSVADDEWYTPYDTAIKVARFMREHLDEVTPILCPADIMPDGQESTIPRAMSCAIWMIKINTRSMPGQLIQLGPGTIIKDLFHQLRWFIN